MSTFTKIFEQNHYELARLVRQSSAWFANEIVNIKKQGRVSAYYLMRGAAQQNKSSIIPGEMYMFYYDAKHKDTLPYWDMFPLVFPFRKLEDGFIGLNMHYLPYPLRVRLLDTLMHFKTDSRLNANTRLKYSWRTIEGFSRLQIAKPCVHRYLASNVRSVFKKVDSPDWATALMLPVERFVGASKQQVWAQSQR